MPYRLWPTVPALLFGLGLLAGCSSLRSGDPDDTKSRTAAKEVAESAAGAATASEDDRALAHAHYGAAIIHDLNGEADAAVEQYFAAARKDPANEWLVLEVSRRLLQNKQTDKALELLQLAVRQPDASGAVYARLGVVYSQLAKYSEAIQACRTAIKKAPRQLAGYQTLAVTYLQNKQNEEAFKLLQSAGKQQKVDPEFLVGLSELWMSYGVQVPSGRTNATSEAIQLLERAASADTLPAALQLKIADGFTMLGESQKAAEIYLEVLKSLPDVPMIREHVHAKLAEIYLRSSDRKKAMEQLEALTKQDPTNPQVFYYMGNIALEERKPEQAAEYLSKTVLLSPNFEPAYYELASAQLSANKPVEALSTLSKARAKFPSNYALELLTGMAFAQQKAYGEAIRYYTAAEVVAKASDPKRLNHIFYLQMGAAQERKGDIEAAELSFKKALELSPDYPEALNYLGYMWAERGMNLEQAKGMLEKAVKAEPKNAAFLDSLGWVLFKLGKPAEALDYLLKSVELLEEPDATVFDHLGDVYAALGQMDKAREAWKKSLSVEAVEGVKKKLDEAEKK